jgi:hypothetical protein
MYFFQNEQLAIELRNGIDDTLKRKYLIFVIALYYIIFALISYDQQYPQIFNPFASFLGLIILLYGIHAAHSVNVKGDAQHFLTRFVCLSLPITLKSLLISILLIIIPIFAFPEYLTEENILLYAIVFSTIFQLLFAYLMVKSMRIASVKK